MSKRIQVVNKIIVLLLVGVLAGCTGFKKVKRETATPSSFQQLSEKQLKLEGKSSPFLKVHMQNGNIYVLQNWAMDAKRQNVIGTGALFNANRDTLRQGNFQVNIDSVAIFETNVLKTSGTVTALTVFTGITAAVTLYCISNPKACFGSCPTFYVPNGDSLHLQAEGFSGSIAPSLEATDIDALFHASGPGKEFDVEMRNEALETHVVRRVNLLAVPRAHGHRVFADLEGKFWESTAVLSPVSAKAPEGDRLGLLLNADGNERYSAADSTYLGAKEFIELEFKNIPQQLSGLVIGVRQSLLSTYLLYQTYAYMGNDAGYWMAQFERNNIQQNQNPIQKIMGGIDVLIQDTAGHWKKISQVYEYGPLATDFHLVPLGRISGDSVKIRLKMTKGSWRIDYVALAMLSKPVQAIRLPPYRVLKDGIEDEKALAILRDTTKALTTLPGDSYILKYRLPATSSDYELFLESQGYYLEWIRKEWIEEQNPFFLSQILLDPQAALKRLAPEYKQVEKEMEDYFWRSRYAKP